MEAIAERVGVLDGSEVGIDPVPREKRTLSAWDVAVLWGDLGIGLLVLVTGALLVPGLGFTTALIAIVIGSVLGVGLLALVAGAGADEGVPSMVLLRPLLGTRGSWVPTALNVAQLIGWTAVELWAMSFVADLVSQEVFGFSARGFWLGAAALVCTALALWGPVAVTRVWMERFGLWVIGGISLAVTILVFTSGDLSLSRLTAAGSGGFPTFGPALDLVIAMPISWLPLVADYTRFATSPRSARAGTFWGYLIANVWLYALGCLLVLGAGATPDPGGIAAGILTLAGGSIAGILFLTGLLVGETDEAFANIYSGAVSLQNVFERVPQKAFVVVIASVGTALAAGFDMLAYESFLFLIGSVFVPLFGVFAASLLARGWGRALAPAAAFAAWIVGFLLYHWVSPSPLDWWIEAVTALVGDPLSVRFTWLSASPVAFAAAAGLALAASRPVSSADRKVARPD